MALKFKTKKAKSLSYGSKRSYDSIKNIVIHYTGNRGDTALDNASYFVNGNTRAAGAHCFIDGSGIVYKSVPINRVAWAVGGFYTQSNGAGSMYKKVTNANSISIEMCNCANGVPDAVYNDAVALTKFYMKKYNIPATNVYRHWDVNGKDCPSPWAKSGSTGWEKFKKAIKGTSGASTSKKVYGKVSTKKDPLNMRKTASTKAAVVCKIPKGVKVEIVSKGTSWHKVKYNGKTGYCSTKYIKL